MELVDTRNMFESEACLHLKRYTKYSHRRMHTLHANVPCMETPGQDCSAICFDRHIHAWSLRHRCQHISVHNHPEVESPELVVYAQDTHDLVTCRS